MNRLPFFFALTATLALAAALMSTRLPLVVVYLSPLVLAGVFCLLRLWAGPRPVDRVAAVGTVEIVIIGVCGVLAATTRQSFFIDIAIAWSIQTFVLVLVLAKHIEGKSIDQ